MSDPEDSDSLDFYESSADESSDSDLSEPEIDASEENYTGKITLTRIVRESYKNSVNFYWKEGLPPQYFYGNLATCLKREPNEPYKYPLICHKNKKPGKKGPDPAQVPDACKYRVQ